MAVQIGAQGTGGSGASSSAGCAGRVTGYIQASTGVLGQLCGQPAFSVWSRMISWRALLRLLRPAETGHIGVKPVPFSIGSALATTLFCRGARGVGAGR